MAGALRAGELRPAGPWREVGRPGAAGSCLPGAAASAPADGAGRVEVQRSGVAQPLCGRLSVVARVPARGSCRSGQRCGLSAFNSRCCGDGPSHRAVPPGRCVC